MIDNSFELIYIARVYAIAAFDFSLEKKEVEHWQEMLEVSTLVSSHKIIKNIISGVLSNKIVSKLFIKLCEPYIDKYFQNFIIIMAEHQRLKLLPNILNIFQHLRMMYYDLTENIEVSTANIISNKQVLKIKKYCETILLRKVQIHFKIDKTLLFGIIIRIGDIIIDSSGRSRINRLAEILQQL
ncbi:MAG: F0F1 ATP synthase subunit delta [Candidatus Dasytiphilus stammeri]